MKSEKHCLAGSGAGGPEGCRSCQFWKSSGCGPFRCSCTRTASRTDWALRSGSKFGSNLRDETASSQINFGCERCSLSQGCYLCWSFTGFHRDGYVHTAVCWSDA